MGVLCALCMIANLYFKWESMTLIFLFNPCHVVCVSASNPAVACCPNRIKLTLTLSVCACVRQTVLIVIAFSNFSVKVEMMALFVFSSAFGG